jgi:EmrB/QacA subfamily drug resistance transporter
LKDSNALTNTAVPGSNNKILVLIIVSFSNLIASFMISGVNVALPSIGREFHANAILLGWVATSFILAGAVFSVPFGRLADIIGVKKIFVYGLVLFILTSIATVFSNSALLLVVLRAIQGISGAMMNSTAIAMLTAVYPAKQRGQALGISMASVYAGLSIGPFFGGLLVDYFDWRSIFIVISPLSFLLLLLMLWKVKGEWAVSRGEKFDYTGSFIYGLSLIALMYGFTLLPYITGIIITAAGCAGIAAFIYRESRNKNPILDLTLFRQNARFTFSNLASMLNYTSTASVVFFLSLYLQYVKGFSPQHAGLIILAQPIVQTFVAPLSGRLSDRIEPGKVASIGMALTCLGLISFCFLNMTTSIGQIVVTMVVLGAGFGLFTSPNTNAIMSSVTPRFYATASSVNGTVRTIGQTLSMGIATMIIALIVGKEEITPVNYPAFVTSARISFIVIASLCFIGIFASLLRSKREPVKNG